MQDSTVTSGSQQPQLSPGIKKGEKVLALQKEIRNLSLGKGRFSNPQKRDQVSTKIAEIFSKTTDYEEMYVMRHFIDSEGKGASALYDLVYDHVNPDDAKTIIRAINASAVKADHKKVHFHNMIYSDVDDTIKPEKFLNDGSTGAKAKDGFYPGVTAFYQELQRPDGQDTHGETPPVQLTFLTARPEALKNNINAPGKMKYHALGGNWRGFRKGLRHYTVWRAVKKVFGSKLESYQRSEEDTYSNFAKRKKENITKDLLLRPEARPIMIGDSGEGDLRFMQDKNSCQNSLETLDGELRRRIPVDELNKLWEQKSWKGNWDDNTPGNPPNRPFYKSFVHDLISIDRGKLCTRPDPKNKAKVEDKNITRFENYVDCATHCLEEGIFSAEQAERVVKDAEEWLYSSRPSVVFRKEKHGTYKVKLKQSIDECNKLINKKRGITEDSISKYDKFLTSPEVIQRKTDLGMKIGKPLKSRLWKKIENSIIPRAIVKSITVIGAAIASVTFCVVGAITFLVQKIFNSIISENSKLKSTARRVEGAYRDCFAIAKEVWSTHEAFNPSPVDRSEKYKGRPLIVGLHGLFDNKTRMKHLLPLVAGKNKDTNRGVTPGDFYFPNYGEPVTRKTIDEYALDMAIRLAEIRKDRGYKGDEKMDVILDGHSMGGLVAARLMQKYADEAGLNVVKIITNGTPWEGSDWAPLGSPIAKCSSQMKEDSKFISDLVLTPGEKSKITVIASRGDTLVPYTSATGKSKLSKDVKIITTEVDEGHLSLLFNETVRNKNKSEISKAWNEAFSLSKT